MTWIRRSPAVLALLLALAACTASGPAAVFGQEETLTLEVAPERVACVGEMEGTCLQVRSPGEAEWRTFYHSIEGFDHETGVRYLLEVGRKEVLDPPADGSSFSYRLIRILERVEGEG